MSDKILIVLLLFFAPWLMSCFSIAPAVADIAIVVNPQNPINELEEHQVKRIFLGRLGMFPNTAKKIHVLDQNSNTDIYRQFYQELIGFRLSKLKRYRASYLFSGQGVLPTEVGDNAAIKEQVVSDIGAVGYLDTAYLDDSVKVVYIWSER